MDYEFDFWTLKAMTERGGSFVKQLAELAHRADRVNFAKIKKTWAEYFDQYFDRGQELRFEACPGGECDGSKEIATDETDNDGNVERGVGTKKCPHHD